MAVCRRSGDWSFSRLVMSSGMRVGIRSQETIDEEDDGYEETKGCGVHF